MPELFAEGDLTWSDARLWPQFEALFTADPAALALIDARGREWTRAELHQRALAMADRLLREEGPTGTWLRFPPWPPELGRVHGRKSWWWGWPLLAAVLHTGGAAALVMAFTWALSTSVSSARAVRPAGTAASSGSFPRREGAAS